jgi:hypothetical protein
MRATGNRPCRQYAEFHFSPKRQNQHINLAPAMTGAACKLVVLPRYAGSAALLTGIFVLSTMAFWRIDFIERHFLTTGSLLVAYQIWRILLFVYLFLILRGIGRLIMAIIKPCVDVPVRLSIGEGIAGETILGGAVWIIIAYVLGVSGLLRTPLVLVLIIPPCVVGLSAMMAELADVAGSLKERAQKFQIDVGSSMFLILTVAAAGYLVVFLGLGMNEFHSDAGHYLPYYLEVASSGSTEPNEFWYHFWMSRGFGLHLLATILLDTTAAPFGPLILLLAASALLFSLVRRVSGSEQIAWLCCLLFLLHFIIWDHHQYKGHFVTLAMITFLLWGIVIVNTNPHPAASVLLTIGSLAAVLTAVPYAVLLLGWFGLLACFYLGAKSGKRIAIRRLEPFLFAMLAVLIVTIGILVLNYLWTGMAEATPYAWFFEHADQSKFSRFVSPYLVLLIQEASTTTSGTLSLDHFDWHGIWVTLHFSGIPLETGKIVLILLLGFVGLSQPPIRNKIGPPILITSTLLAVTACLGLLAHEPDSQQRSFVFCLPVAMFLVAICITSAACMGARIFSAMLAKAAPTADIGQVQRRGTMDTVLSRLKTTVLWFVTLVAATYFIHQVTAAFPDVTQRRILSHDFRFLTGHESLADDTDTPSPCLKMLELLAGRDAAAASPAPSVKVWALPLLEPLGCFLMPKVRILTEMRNSLGPHWHRIVFGSIADARRELKLLNIRYFYVDFDPRPRANPSAALLGCIAYSDLFSTESLARNFRIVWRDGTQALLELAELPSLEAGTPDELLARWDEKKAMKQYGVWQMKELCERVRMYYGNNGENWPVKKDSFLPALTGFQ